jgi:restriction system protein
LDLILLGYVFPNWGIHMSGFYSDLMLPWHQKMLQGETETLATVEPKDPCAAIGPDTRSIIELAYQQMLQSLCAQLIGYIYAQDHQFFERLVVDVVFSLGYGGRRRDLARTLGRSGDGGIDGVVALDELGLDVVYLQAKRLKPGSIVAVSAVRDFVGSLEAKHATKGIFVTTGHFSPAAQDVVNSVSKKIILISGEKLTELMARYNIGVKATETLQFKEVDISYFSNLGTKPAGNVKISASLQPSRYNAQR